MIYWVKVRDFNKKDEKQNAIIPFDNWNLIRLNFSTTMYFEKLSEISKCLSELTTKDIFIIIYKTQGFVWFLLDKENAIDNKTDKKHYKFPYLQFFEMNTFDILCELSNQDML